MAATIRMCSRVARGIYGLQRNPSNSLAFQSWRTLSAAATETNSDASETKSSDKPEDLQNEVAQALAKAEEKFKTETEKLTKSAEEMQDKYKRSLAETENVRRRMQKQIDDAKLFGIQGFCKDLLDVADVLSKATESVPKEELNHSNPHLKNLYDGLVMTESQLIKVFSKNGLNVINPADGEKFDPNFHEALFEQPMPGKEPGTVAIVTKIGYSLHKRTLRPALVGVVKAP